MSALPVDRAPAPDSIVIPKTVAALAIEAAAAAFGVASSNLVGPRRLRRFVRARQIAIGILRETVRSHGGVWSLPEIGRRFGGRDHTTVLHSVRRYRAWCAACGLDPAPADFHVWARAIAAHLGMLAPPDAEPSQPPPGSQDNGEIAVSKTIAPVSAIVAEAPDAASDRITPLAAPGLDPDFGVFRIALGDWSKLPPAMQGDGARLAIEHAGSLVLAGLHTGLPVELLEAAIALEHPPHDLPRINEATWTPEEDPAPRDFHAPPPAAEHDPGFLSFAQIHLVAGASLEVPAAYATYQAFCKGRGALVMPRSSFGAALLVLARSHGGARAGDVLSGLALRDGRPAPAWPSVPPAIAPKPRPPREPLVLGALPARRSGRRVVYVGDDGSRIERRVRP